MSYIKLEPKYCELCGALWLRPSDSNHSYCAACARRLQRIARTQDGPRRREQ